MVSSSRPPGTHEVFSPVLFPDVFVLGGGWVVTIMDTIVQWGQVQPMVAASRVLVSGIGPNGGSIHRRHHMCLNY